MPITIMTNTKTAEGLTQQLNEQRRRVDFDTFDVMVQQLIAMVGSRSIDVAPAYQRQFRWDNERRSQLIESLFLGIPVPSLFMATNPDSTWELVDGVQRLSTIVQFAGTPEARDVLKLQKPLELVKLTKLSNFNEKTFDSLPKNLQLHFGLRPIKIVTLSDKSDMVVRFDLFERLNNGGVSLTSQEIRSCIYRGQFNDFIAGCAQNIHFNAVVKLTDRQKQDGTKEEMVLRFFAFLNRYKQFDHSVIEFLNQYMQDANKTFNYNVGSAIFEKTFEELSKCLPNGIVRTASRSVTPTNLYEAVSVGAALAIQAKGKIAPSADPSRWIGSEELKSVTLGATNNKKSVIGRIEFCRDKFIG